MSSLLWPLVAATAAWLIDRLPPVRWAWARFIRETDRQPFWSGAYPEMRLCGVAFFFMALPGFIIAVIGEYFYEHILGFILWNAGGLFVALGVALGFYSVLIAVLRFLGLRSNPAGSGQSA